MLIVRILVPGVYNMLFPCDRIRDNIISEKEVHFKFQEYVGEGLWEDLFILKLNEDSKPHTIFTMNSEGKTIDKYQWHVSKD